VKEDKLEDIISYELVQNQRVIPRYFHYLELLNRVEIFCDTYGETSFVERHIRSLKTNQDEVEALMSGIKMHKSEPEFNVASDLVNILTADPYPWDFPGSDIDWLKQLWKTPVPFKGKPIPLDLRDIIRKFSVTIDSDTHENKKKEVRSIFSKSYIQKYLANLAPDFIRDYEKLIKQYAFSYADLWELKERYLEKVYQCIRNKKATRPSNSHREACREVAKVLWAKESSITIADMCICDEIAIACEQEVYDEKTLRKWIKDLCPNRKPGRRPKKKSK
jgi:hypothetical protein